MEKELPNNPKNTNEQQLILETKKGNISSNGKLITARVQVGYCNETTQSGPSTHSQIYQVQNISKKCRGKTKNSLYKEKNERTCVVLYVL